MKLQQRNLDQTGVAILELEDGSIKEIPLYSLEPIQEADTIVENFYPTCTHKCVYFTNNLMPNHTKIEDIISVYMKQNGGVLPEDLMEDLVSGFPYIRGNEPDFKNAYYA